MFSEGMLSLRCIDRKGKVVFDLSSTSLISLYAFVLAHLRHPETLGLHSGPDIDPETIGIEWEYFHFLKDEENGICAKWKVLGSEDRVRMYSGIIRRSPRTGAADFSVRSTHAVFTSRDFLELADRIHLGLMNLSGGDIDLARSAMLFAAQMTDHPFWSKVKR